jgi:hypothetical protein
VAQMTQKIWEAQLPDISSGTVAPDLCWRAVGLPTMRDWMTTMSRLQEGVHLLHQIKRLGFLSEGAARVGVAESRPSKI